MKPSLINMRDRIQEHNYKVVHCCVLYSNSSKNETYKILCVQINHSSTGSTYEHATYITIVVLKKQFSVFSVLPAAYASDLLEYNEEVFPS